MDSRLEAFVAGDQAAFESLFREHQREVYRWIVRIVRDPAAADDLTIETFWRIYRSRARFDPSRHPRRGFGWDGTIRLVYAGALTPTYELDVAIDAVARIAERRPILPLRFEIFGRGDSEAALRDTVMGTGAGAPGAPDA